MIYSNDCVYEHTFYQSIKKYRLHCNNITVYFLYSILIITRGFVFLRLKYFIWIYFFTYICISCVIFSVNALMYLLRWSCPFSQQISANSFLLAKMAQSKISEIFIICEGSPAKKKNKSIRTICHDSYCFTTLEWHNNRWQVFCFYIKHWFNNLEVYLKTNYSKKKLDPRVILLKDKTIT